MNEDITIKIISPNDQMYAGNDSHYFGVGLSALECIDVAMASAKKVPVILGLF